MECTKRTISKGVARRMGLKVALDTNTFLNMKNKEAQFYFYSKKILEAIDQGEMEAVISIVTIAELIIGYYKNKELKEKEEFIRGLYANKNYKIINLDFILAEKAGEIKSKTNLKMPDCIIIASSILEKVPILITNDSKFDKAKDLLQIMVPEEFYLKYLKTEEIKAKSKK